MKTNELRLAMVARAKEAFGKWRTFSDMPEVTNEFYDIRIGIKGDLKMESVYVGALNSICAIATPIGRIGQDLVGLANEDAAKAGQRIGEVQLRLEAAPKDD